MATTSRWPGDQKNQVDEETMKSLMKRPAMAKKRVMASSATEADDEKEGPEPEADDEKDGPAAEEEE